MNNKLNERDREIYEAGYIACFEHIMPIVNKATDALQEKITDLREENNTLKDKNGNLRECLQDILKYIIGAFHTKITQVLNDNE